MARIKLLEVDEMNEEQKKQYYEFPSNLARGLIATKNLGPAYAALGSALRFIELSAKEREFVIVRVGYMSNSDYEIMQHKELALNQGWTNEDLEAIRENNISHFDERTATLLHFVNECVQLVKVSDQTFMAARNYYTESIIAEIPLLVGHYMMTARFLETLEIDLDEKPTSWDNVTQKK